MPDPYAGSPVDHATISVPVDSDEPSGAVFATPSEQLLDKMLFIRAQQGGQITALQGNADRGWADFLVGGTVNANLWIQLTVETGDMGAGASGVTRSAHTGGVADGHYFQLGDPSEDDAAGLWEIEIEITLTAADDGIASVTLYRHDGSSDPFVDEVAVRTWYERVTSGLKSTVRGTFRDYIPTPIGVNAPRYSLRWGAGTDAHTLGTGLEEPRVYVTQINRAL